MTTTAKDWRTLDAGRELDALVAERVMGWKGVRVTHGPGLRPTLFGTRPKEGRKAGKTLPVPRYSTDVAAAWLVVLAVQRRNPGWRFSLLGGDVSYGYVGGSPSRGVDRGRLESFGWHAEFHGHIDPAENFGQRHGDEWAESAPLAIARAALAATEAR